jgi:hypothetical protein
MTITAQSIVLELHDTLHDIGGIRWPADELVRYLNDAQREIVTLRPDLVAKLYATPLVVGAKQQVPTDCSKLFEVDRNTNGPTVRQVERTMLDALDPDWYTRPGSKYAKHFTFDIREPRAFYVYPCALANTSVDLLYAAFPADIAVPAGPSHSDVTGNITVDDVFKNIMFFFAMSRALAKDAEYTGDRVSSDAYAQRFMTGLGTEATVRQAVQPAIINKVTA